ncbi:MAG: GIY-YIG nuclease family protein, partial [Gammaproteobacteria bacterium]
WMKRMPDRSPCVYILASKPYGTLYIGVTSDLVNRVWQHRSSLCEGFTKRYKIHKLVWFELHDRMDIAIEREKSLKNWKRIWKIKLIEQSNPDWQDLYFGL